jgi:hypothetical protein
MDSDFLPLPTHFKTIKGLKYNIIFLNPPENGSQQKRPDSVARDLLDRGGGFFSRRFSPLMDS